MVLLDIRMSCYSLCLHVVTLEGVEHYVLIKQVIVKHVFQSHPTQYDA